MHTTPCSDRRRSLRTRFVVVGLLWLVLTAASAVVYRATWVGEGAAGQPDQSSVLKLACNVIQVAGGPVWYGLWYATGDTSSWRTAIAGSAGTWGGWACVVLMVLALRDRWLARGRRAAVQPVPALRASEPVRAAAPLAVPNPMRRRLLFDVPVAGLILSAAGMGGAATLVTPWRVEVRRYRVKIADLPREFEGFRIVQISDTHLGPRVPAEFLEDVVAQSLSLRPDVVVLTGDYVHMGSTYSAGAAAVFRPIVDEVAARRTGGLIGVAGVLGNHDHYAGAATVTADMRAVGVTMIDHDRVFVDLANRRLVREEPAGPTLAVCGLGDFQHGRANPASTFLGVKPGTARIVLAHNPDSAEDDALLKPNGTAAERVDLMLSGHTHGGQVALPIVGPLVTFSRHWKKYAHGLNHGPLGPVITSAGIGMSVFPVRWGVPPEIVEVTLTGAASG